MPSAVTVKNVENQDKIIFSRYQVHFFTDIAIVLYSGLSIVQKKMRCQLYVEHV